MRIVERSATAFLLTLGLAMGTGTALQAAGGGAWFQAYPGAYPAPYTDMRGLVDRTQADLRAAADLEHGNEKQRNRYRDAQEHLSNFDRELTKGHFDKGQLNSSIDKIHDILNHNVLQASSRDALMRDEGDLKVARDRRW